MITGIDPKLVYGVWQLEGEIEPGYRRTCVLSHCGFYRYVLMEQWEEPAHPLCFAMLNPADATHLTPDHTASKLRGFSIRMGFNGWIAVNKFAWRDKNAKALRAAPDPVGPLNDLFIDMMMREHKSWVFAWGGSAPKRLSKARVEAICLMAKKNGIHPLQFGTGSNGHPKHPLMLGYDTPLIPFQHPILNP